jgi:hypothetical protein
MQPTLLEFSISISIALDESILMEYVYPDYGIDIGDKIFIEDLKCLRYG